MEQSENLDELCNILKDLCTYFNGEHYEEIKRVLLKWCKLVAIQLFPLDTNDIPDVSTLEQFTHMSYQYADEDERLYYEQWRIDLEAKWACRVTELLEKEYNEYIKHLDDTYENTSQTTYLFRVNTLVNNL